MERRELLKRAAVAGAAGLTGLAAYGTYQETRPDGDAPAEPTPDVPDQPEQTPQPTPPPEKTPPEEERPVRHEDAFDTVIGAVEAGADPEGNEPIGEFLKRHAGDDTLLSFPAGTYLLPQIELNGYDRLGIAASHDEHPTFVAPVDSCLNTDPHVQFAEVTNFLMEGIDFDFRQDGAGGAINVIASGDATVRDVTAQGSCNDQIAMFRMDIRDPEGTGLAENVRAKHVQDTGWMTGAYVGKRHSGDLTFRNCEFSEFTDNGLYGSAPGTDGGGGGTVHTVDGHFENNNVSNIRLGTSGSSARNDTIVVESAPDAEAINLRGIRLRRGDDQVVDNCDVTYGSSVTNSFGAVVFHADNGGARVSNSHIKMHSDGVPAIRTFYGESDSDSSPTFENLTVDGDASRGYAMMINGRDGTSIRNCTIEQPGTRRDGIRLAYSSDCELIDSRVDVTGFPLILRDATLTIRNTTFVTPDGEYHVEEMEAGPGDFRPETWTDMSRGATTTGGQNTTSGQRTAQEGR